MKTTTKYGSRGHFLELLSFVQFYNFRVKIPSALIQYLLDGEFLFLPNNFAKITKCRVFFFYFSIFEIDL